MIFLSLITVKALSLHQPYWNLLHVAANRMHLVQEETAAAGWPRCLAPLTVIAKLKRSALTPIQCIIILPALIWMTGMWRIMTGSSWSQFSNINEFQFFRGICSMLYIMCMFYVRSHNTCNLYHYATVWWFSNLDIGPIKWLGTINKIEEYFWLENHHSRYYDWLY